MFEIARIDTFDRHDDEYIDRAELAVEKLDPIASEMRRILKDKGHVDAVLKEGGERASAIAAPVLKTVRKIVGLLG